MLKKTTLAVLGLVANSFAFAGAMGPVCTPGNVTVPCEAKQWSFGVDALYLKAVDSVPMALRANVLGSGFTELNNQWNWGFVATGAYHYNTGNDISISWLHYSNSENQLGLSGIFVVPVVGTPLSLPYTLIAQNRIDKINAVTGQHIYAGLIDKMRFYAGMQYAQIQQNMTNYFVPGNYFDNNDFKGLGPVVGINYSYDVSPQVSLVADGATSLLYGTTRMSTGYVVNPLAFGTTYSSHKNVVPGFEAKLGINYAYAMPQGTINLQGGYQIDEYFHVLKTRANQSSLNPIVPTDYALYGPYIGLKYVGNV